MSDSETYSTLQRILVAHDGSPHSQAALNAAIHLATSFDGVVEGLFVEDERLHRAAQLPFSKEIRTYTAPPLRLSDRRMHRQLRYQSEYAKHTLQRAAEEAEVPYEFRSVQGRVTEELMRAATQADVVVLGKTSKASSRRKLGGTCRALLSDAPVPVLVARNAVPSEAPTLVYYDGSPAARVALDLGARISQQTNGLPLDVLIPNDDAEEGSRLREEIHNRYRDTKALLRIHWLSRAEIHRLSAFARQNGGLVILPSDCPPLCSMPLEQFLYEIDRPLLVVR